MERDFSKEFVFTTSRSGGPGGQHVNKVNSKVTLRFDIGRSAILRETEKERLRKKADNRISGDGTLILSAESHRSQLKNKEEVIDKFYRLLKKSLQKKKARKPTQPTASAIEKRLNQKKRQAEKKKWRQIP